MHENRSKNRAKAATPLFLALPVFAFPKLVLAHPGHDLVPTAPGFVAGFVHPLTSVEHLLTLIIVGIVVAKLDRVTIWLGALALIGVSTALIAAGEHGVTVAYIVGVAAGSAIATLASGAVAFANLRMLAADRAEHAADERRG